MIEDYQPLRGGVNAGIRALDISPTSAVFLAGGDAQIPRLRQDASRVQICFYPVKGVGSHGRNQAMRKTGDAAYDETVKSALGIESDHLIVGFIHLGTDTGGPKTRPPRSPEEYVRRWTGTVAT
jgi:hypothetical protein